MPEATVGRRRPIIKSLAFTNAEWAIVERRMTLSGQSFARYGREAILNGQIVVKRIAFDPSKLGAELARIGNNINQVARMANTESVATADDVRAVRAMVREIQGLIEKAMKEV